MEEEQFIQNLESNGRSTNKLKSKIISEQNGITEFYAENQMVDQIEID